MRTVTYCLCIALCGPIPDLRADSYLLWDWSPQATGYAGIGNTSAYSNEIGSQEFAERISFPAWVRIVAMDNFSWDTDGQVGDPAITSLYDEVGGLPGTRVTRFESTISVIDELGSGDHNNRKHVPFTQDVILQPATPYWIGLASTNAHPFAQMGLPYVLQPGISINPPGDGQMAHFPNGVLVGLSGVSAGDMAFRLHGQLLGDGNSDYRIDGADFLHWQRELGTTGIEAYSQADFSGDGAVSTDDLAIWQAGFGAAIDLAANGEVTAVPSPSSSVLASIGLATLIAFKRR